MHGAPQAGKTSVKVVLEGKPPQRKQNSTGIIESPVRLISTSRFISNSQEAVLDEVNNDKLIKMIATQIHPNFESWESNEGLHAKIQDKEANNVNPTFKNSAIILNDKANMTLQSHDMSTVKEKETSSIIVTPTSSKIPNMTLQSHDMSAKQKETSAIIVTPTSSKLPNMTQQSHDMSAKQKETSAIIVTPTSSKLPNMTQQSHDMSTAKQKDKSAVTQTSSSSQTSSNAAIPQESKLQSEAYDIPNIYKELDNIAIDSTDLFNLHWIHIVDSGGQPQFTDVVPLMYQSATLHIVVIRLDKTLHEKLEVKYVVNDKNEYKFPEYLSLSSLQMIERTCEFAKSKQAWVMIVGTYLDHESSEEPLEEKNKQLKKLLKKYYDVIILAHDQNIIFPMNAITDDMEERAKYRHDLHFDT